MQENPPPQTATLLVKKGEFGPEEVEQVRDFSRQRQFDPIYFPGIKASDTNQYDVLSPDVYYLAFSQLLAPEGSGEFYRKHPYEVTPTTDDRPFFSRFFLSFLSHQQIHASVFLCLR